MAFNPSDLGKVRPFKPRGDRQQEAWEIVSRHACTFLIGPAGTAKTLLCAAKAVDDLIEGRSERIVLARPARQGGDDLGYFPGTQVDKMKGFALPFLDNLACFLGADTVTHLVEEGLIELLNMGLLDGRTFRNCTYILDEMQNATANEAREALTRPGDNCRMLLTANPTQIKLAEPDQSFVHELWRFRDLPGIGLVEFGLADVVRSKLARQILRAWGEN